MRRLRILVILAFMACSVNVAYAYLPANIENTIKGWFSGAGNLVRMTFTASNQPGTSSMNKLVIYYDSADKCLKASSSGNAFSCIAGTGAGSGAGCYFAPSGALTCTGGFDTPAAAAAGGCVTLKEGSNNGTSTIANCAPANLSTSRTNTMNADGTYKASDIETADTNEYGLDLIFNTLTGIITGRANPAYVWLPDGAPAIDPAGGEVAVLAANGMRCATFVARDSIKAATNLAHYVSTLGGNCSTCLYSEDGTTLIAPLVSGVAATASDCTGTGVKTMTGLDPFTLAKGTRYRLCTTSSSNLTKWFKGPYYASVLANAVATTAGTAANSGTSGKCPTATGSLSAADVYPPITRVY